MYLIVLKIMWIKCVVLWIVHYQVEHQLRDSSADS